MKLLRAAALSLVPVATEGLMAAEDVVADADPDRASWDIEAYYAGDLWQNVHGGVERGGAYLDSLDVIVT